MTRAVLDPCKIRDSFAESVQRIYGLYANLKDRATDAERSVLAEQTLVSLAVAFETFTSDLVVALICKQPDLYLHSLSEDMKRALLSASYSHPQIQYLTSDVPKKPSTDELRQIILGSGDNLAFPETQRLKEFLTKRVARDLVFDIEKEDAIFLDLLKALRNFCAHRSPKAARALNGQLRQAYHDHKVKDTVVCRVLGQNSDLTARTIGSYLKKRAPSCGQQTRIEFIAIKLREIAFKWVKG